MICSLCAAITTNREVFYTGAMNDFSVLLKMHLFLTVRNGHTCNYIFMSILICQLKIKKKKPCEEKVEFISEKQAHRMINQNSNRRVCFIQISEFRTTVTTAREDS